MQLINHPQQQGVVADSAWQGRRDDAAPQDTALFIARLNFRDFSNHISQRKPGYYLILLRNELRHRSLRDKPALVD
jgi:hypothetical protein